MSETERIVLLRKYPTARSLSEAYDLALESAKDESQDLPQSNRATLWYKAQNFLKFTLAVTMVMFVIGIRAGLPVGSQIAKLLLMLILLACSWAVSLVGLLYQQEQQFRDGWRPVTLALQKDAVSLMAAPMTDEERTKIAMEQGLRWWRVYVLDPDRRIWFRRTFLSQTREGTASSGPRADA